MVRPLNAPCSTVISEDNLFWIGAPIGGCDELVRSKCVFIEFWLGEHAT